MRPGRYQGVVLGVGFLLMLIVLTGAAVRLAEAGLGCEDWPNCNAGELAPGASVPGWIEFGNRMLSGLVGLACLAAVWGAYKRLPRRRDLILLSWGLVLGSAAQVLLGRFIIELDLHPIAVGGHFLLSMLMLWNVVVLWIRSGTASVPVTEARVGPRLIAHGRLLAILAFVILVLGVAVTGTGPHSGDVQAERLPFDFTTIARTHSASVWLFLAVLVAFAMSVMGGRAVTGPNPGLSVDDGGKAAPNGSAHHGLPVQWGRAMTTDRLVRWLMMAVVAQGAVGYTQYLTGLPRLLVEVHILGSIVVWMLALLVYFSLYRRTESRDLATGVEEAVEAMQ